MGVTHRRGFSRWLKPLLAATARHHHGIPSSQASPVMHLCPGLGPRWFAGGWPFVATRTLVPAESTAKTSHEEEFPRLNHTALVLAVKASRQPHD